MLVNISKIKIGKRIRVEYGDIQELAESIEQYGLLHPIVIDADYNLVAGGRRLLATERIGLKEIEVKILGELTEKELRVLELEENIRRKDLTEIEKSRNLVELVEIKQDLAKRDFVSESDSNPVPESVNDSIENTFFTESVKKVMGRPKGSEKLDSIRNISERIGIPPQTNKSFMIK